MHSIGYPRTQRTSNALPVRTASRSVSRTRQRPKRILVRGLNGLGEICTVYLIVSVSGLFSTRVDPCLFGSVASKILAANPILRFSCHKERSA